MPGGQPLSQYSTDYKQARGNGGLTEPDVRFTQGPPLICCFHCDCGFAGAFVFRVGPSLTGPVCGLASTAAYGWNRWDML